MTIDFDNIHNTSVKINKRLGFGSDAHTYMTHVIPEFVETCTTVNPSLVIDAGCGRNLYKDIIPNLQGFDSGNYEEADFQSTILDANFEKESADAVISQGVIHFYSKATIKKNIKQVVEWVKPGGKLCMMVNYNDQNMRTMLQLTNNPLSIVPWDDNFLNEITQENSLKFYKDPWFIDWQMSKRPGSKKYVKAFSKNENLKSLWEESSNNLKKLLWIWEKPNV